jgi:hypothetical protein
MLTPSSSNIIVSSDRHDPKSQPVEDIAQAFKFLKLIDPRATTFAFQTFREKGDTESSAEPKVIHSDSLTELHCEHVAGAGIYLTVNETDGRGRRAEDIVRVRAVFRVPGFWHRKRAPFMVRIVEASGQRYTRERILATFPPVPREPIKVREWKPCGDSWPRGLVRAVAKAAVGERNPILFWANCRCSEAVRDGKAAEDLVVDVLIEAAMHVGLPEREAQRTVRSGMCRS